MSKYDSSVDPEVFTETRNGNGSAIYMTAGVHCCRCWAYGEELSVFKQNVVSAVDVLQTSGIKDSIAYKAAERFLEIAFSKKASLRDE
jgi:hypothetical protein